MKIGNLLGNDDVMIVEQNDAYGVKIIKYRRDLSVTKDTAIQEYFAAQMDCCKKEAVISLNNSSWVLSAGAMHWMGGNIEVKTDVQGAGDFLKKTFVGKATGESGIKPVYYGSGILVLEPTYKHLLIEPIANWNGGMVMQDSLFLAASGDCHVTAQRINSVSGVIAGGEGLFNPMVTGNGIVIVESPVPRNELVEVILENDTLKIDGNYAICWTSGLQFTVERTTKTLVGSAFSGEGLVNVYRGTGKVWIAPK